MSYLQKHGRVLGVGDRPIARRLPTPYKIDTNRKQKAGFEPTILTSEQYKTEHGLNYAAAESKNFGFYDTFSFV